MRRLLTGLVLSFAAGLLAMGCGDDEVPEAAVVWLNLSQMEGGNCTAIASFQLPEETAAATIQGNISDTPRLEDGVDGRVIDCRVRRNAEGTYDVSLSLRSPELTLFQAIGSLDEETGGALSVVVQAARTGSLTQTDCTAEVEAITENAVWVSSLRCDDLRDRLSPNVLCLGTGGILFERCQG